MRNAPANTTRYHHFDVTIGLPKELSTKEDETKQRLVYSSLNNTLGHWDEIRETMGIFAEET